MVVLMKNRVMRSLCSLWILQGDLGMRYDMSTPVCAATTATQMGRIAPYRLTGGAAHARMLQDLKRAMK